MHYHTDDTIAAVASAPGGAYRGIVRASGRGVLDCLAPLFRADDDVALASIVSPTAVAGTFSTGEFTHPLPCRLYVWPTRRSFTRQPLAEIHTIGSPPLLDAVLNALCRAGARLAEPGEFTLRAFLAGRIDLTQAEAVLGVIDAHGQRQLSDALAQLGGGLATPLHNLRERLLDLLAHLEAGLDFAEEDIAFISADELCGQLESAAEEVARLLDKMTSRHIDSAEARVVLVGLANAGKSSLFNALVEDDAAIVSPQAGTTRDYVSATIDCDGAACLLIDTAGEQAPPDPADAASLAGQAQRATGEQAQQAHLRLLCVDVCAALSAADLQRIGKLAPSADLVVYTKIDQMAGTRAARRPSKAVESSAPAVFTSSVTREGLPELRAAIAGAVAAQHEDSAGVVAATAARCRDSLRQAGESLTSARQGVREGLGEELIAAEIRIALEQLGRVVGAVYTDDILDRVFSRFCIGK